MRPQERSPEERLINLMVSLSTSRAPRTFAQLRRDTVAYVQSDDESARRMFERDKDALRRMGVPIETVDTGGVPGYRIDRADWRAHDIRLDHDEVAALAVGIALAGGQRERLALSRLTARAPDPDPATTVPSLRMEVVDDGLDPVAEAVADRSTVRFGYRRADGAHMVRTVDAWGLVLRNGAAYLIGWDHDRAARRTFRLSRVTGRVRAVTVDEPRTVPADFDAASVLDEVHGDGTEVQVWVRPSAVGELEQRGGVLVDDEDTRDDGWQRGRLPEADAVRLRDWLLAAADRVVVAGPPWLREEVTTALRALVAMDLEAAQHLSREPAGTVGQGRTDQSDTGARA